jgi:hypothetical protein
MISRRNLLLRNIELRKKRSIRFDLIMESRIKERDNIDNIDDFDLMIDKINKFAKNFTQSTYSWIQK